MSESLVTFFSVVIGGIVFCVLVVLSVMRRSKGWQISVYAISLIPAGVQARNHGFSLEVLLAVCFFLFLTWVILRFARKEIGESHTSENNGEQ